MRIPLWFTEIFIPVVIGFLAVLVVIGLSSCSPAPEILLTPQATSTQTPIPTATLPPPDLDEIIPLAKGIEAMRFPDVWPGSFDVIHAAGGSVVIVVNLSPTETLTSDQSTAIYPQIFQFMCQYMLDNFPGRDLRVILTSVYRAYGPDGEAKYYQADWYLTVKPSTQQKIVDGPPKAIGATPTVEDPTAYFWRIAGQEIIGEEVADIINRQELVAWENEAIPTRTPVPTATP